MDRFVKSEPVPETQPNPALVRVYGWAGFAWGCVARAQRGRDSHGRWVAGVLPGSTGRVPGASHCPCALAPRPDARAGSGGQDCGGCCAERHARRAAVHPFQGLRAKQGTCGGEGRGRGRKRASVRRSWRLAATPNPLPGRLAWQAAWPTFQQAAAQLQVPARNWFHAVQGCAGWESAGAWLTTV